MNGTRHYSGITLAVVSCALLYVGAYYLLVLPGPGVINDRRCYSVPVVRVLPKSLAMKTFQPLYWLDRHYLRPTTWEREIPIEDILRVLPPIDYASYKPTLKCDGDNQPMHTDLVPPAASRPAVPHG